MIFRYHDFISEGLIKTHDLNKLINYLNKVSNGYMCDVSFNRGENSLSYKTNCRYETFYENLLNQVFNLYGYFPSAITIYKEINGLDIPKYEKFTKGFLYNNIKNVNFKSVEIIFEMKFDKQTIIKSCKLYHVFNVKDRDSILKRGLIPKSRKRKSDHPERIYFAMDIQFANDIISQFKFTDLCNYNDDNEYGIMEINIEKMRNDMGDYYNLVFLK